MRFAPEYFTRQPDLLGFRPLASRSTPALYSSSWYLCISLISFSPGITPFSESLVALTMIMNRMVFSSDREPSPRAASTGSKKPRSQPYDEWARAKSTRRADSLGHLGTYRRDFLAASMLVHQAFGFFHLGAGALFSACTSARSEVGEALEALRPPSLHAREHLGSDWS